MYIYIYIYIYIEPLFYNTILYSSPVDKVQNNLCSQQRVNLIKGHPGNNIDIEVPVMEI